MNPEELSKIEALKILKARYCRYIDERRLDEFFNLFTEDAIFGVPEVAHSDPNSDEAKYKAGYMVGRQAIREAIVRMGESISSGVHHVHAPEIELTSPNMAKGIWAYTDHLYFRSGPIKAAHGFGHYHETYVLQDGDWKIKTCNPVRIRIDVEMADPEKTS